MGIRDFHLDQQAFFASAFPYWVIQQNISFRTATHAETIAIFSFLEEVLAVHSTHLTPHFKPQSSAVTGTVYGTLSSYSIMLDLRLT